MLETLFGYKAWSDDRLLRAINNANISNGCDLDGFIRQQLNHMLIVEELFKARLTHNPEPHTQTNTEVLPELDELFQRQQRSNKWYQTYVASLSDGGLKQRIRFVFIDGKPADMSIHEILMHISHHGVYHRSAIGHALQHNGFERPADTYTMYLHANNE